MNWYEAVTEARLHGINVEQLAHALGVDPNILKQWEDEERPVEPNQKQAFDKALNKLTD